jgi:uncharacterized RDD family membrane protein YckC
MQEVDIIETPENVELQVPLAGMGSRLLAGIIDHLIIVLIYIILGLILAFGGSFMALVEGAGSADMWALAVIICLFFLIHWGYFILFEFFMNGQSPGKKQQKIRVAQRGGRPVTFLDVLIRNLLRPVDALGGYAVAGVFMFFSSRIQRLGDLAAGTVVVSEQTPDYSARTDKSKDRLEWQERQVSARDLRDSRLEPREYRLLSNYWGRRHQLTSEARERVLRRLMESVMTREGEDPNDYDLETLERRVHGLISSVDQSNAPPDSEREGP